jgi:ADP-ribose pyrophosphatase
MKKLMLGPLKTVFTGKVFKIHQRTVTLPTGEKKLFEYCERPTSVTILAFDKHNKLLLIREHRHNSQKKVWFLPAGKLEKKNDTPKKAALRELREETGYTAKTIKLMHTKSATSTMMWDIFVFAAKDLFWAPLPGDEHYPIEVVPVSLAKAVQMAKDGTIENEYIAYTIIRFEYMMRKGEFKW